MKQIKTIQNANPLVFDTDVNTALLEGWTLTRRYYNHGEFIAELECEVVTEDEKSCENCAHFLKDPAQEPCLSCGDDVDKWEPVNA